MSTPTLVPTPVQLGKAWTVHYERVTNAATQELVAAYLHFELHLEDRAIICVTASGLEDANQVSALRTALETKSDEQLEACLPLGLSPAAPRSSRAKSDELWVEVVNRAGKSKQPDASAAVLVLRTSWEAALDSLAKQWAELGPLDQQPWAEKAVQASRTAIVQTLDAQARRWKAERPEE